MSDLMIFPKTWEEFERSYGFTDKDEVYTNSARLIPSFRVEQWLEHMETQAVNKDHVRHSDGHWVHGKELSRDYIGDACIGVHYDKWWCSECNYTVEGQPLWRYCPRCGAKMDEVINDID